MTISMMALIPKNTEVAAQLNRVIDDGFDFDDDFYDEFDEFYLDGQSFCR